MNCEECGKPCEIEKAMLNDAEYWYCPMCDAVYQKAKKK